MGSIELMHACARIQLLSFASMTCHPCVRLLFLFSPAMMMCWVTVKKRKKRNAN